VRIRSCRLPIDVVAHRGGRAVLEAVLASTPGVLRVRVVAACRAVDVEYDGSVLTAAELARIVPGLLRPGAPAARRTVHRRRARRGSWYRRRRSRGTHRRRRRPRPTTGPAAAPVGGPDAG
jgi:hypothetical protein